MIRVLNTISKYSRILNLAHDMADCDSTASAYAFSQVVGGDLGFFGSLKQSAINLLEFLDAKYVCRPNWNDYDFVWLHDVGGVNLIGGEIPPIDFGIIDHHGKTSKDIVPLIQKSQCTIIEDKCSTSCITFELLKRSGVAIDQKVIKALATGFITDTGMLQRANYNNFQEFYEMLNIGQINIGELIRVVYKSPSIENTTAFIDILKGLKKYVIDDCLFVSAFAYSHDDAFHIADLLCPKGVDALMICFSEQPGRSTLRTFFSQKILARVNKLELFLKTARNKKMVDIWAGGIHAECEKEELMMSFENNIAEFMDRSSKGA